VRAVHVERVPIEEATAGGPHHRILAGDENLRGFVDNDADNSASRYYDDNDGKLLHEEVRSLLLRLQGGSIVTAIESGSAGAQLMRRHFVVSALGQPHVYDRLNSHGITPFRCTDPLRWITTSFGVV
jgi:hypothetical protein